MLDVIPAATVVTENIIATSSTLLGYCCKKKAGK